MTSGVTKYRRTLRKVYDGENNETMTVLFPKFISELYAVAKALKTDSVQEIISHCQGMCLAEGLRPSWRKITQEEINAEAKRKRMQDRALRMVDKRMQLRREREALAESFPDRVKKTRNAMGDF